MTSFASRSRIKYQNCYGKAVCSFFHRWRDSHNYDWPSRNPLAIWIAHGNLSAIATPKLTEQLTSLLFKKKSAVDRLRKTRSTFNVLRSQAKEKRTANNQLVRRRGSDDDDVEALLADLTRDSGLVVLVWYRGLWCVWCKSYMRKFNKQLARIESIGGTVIGVCAQEQSVCQTTQERWGLDFPIIGDPKNILHKKYGGDITLDFDIAANYPYGVGQPALLAYLPDQENRVIYYWASRTSFANLWGGRDRPEPRRVAKDLVEKTLKARGGLSSHASSLDFFDSSWESLDLSGSSSASFDESDYSESTDDALVAPENRAADLLMSCEDPAICSIVSQVVDKKPEIERQIIMQLAMANPGLFCSVCKKKKLTRAGTSSGT